MKKIYLAFIALLLFSLASRGQSGNISGTVMQSEEKKPIENAVIALLTSKDSILYKFTRSNTEGKYYFQNVENGEYILMTTHPYYADVLDDINIKGDVTLPAYSLISKAKLLQEVIVKTGSPIKIKGDTTIYTADSFRVSANANVEELLKKTTRHSGGSRW